MDIRWLLSFGLLMLFDREIMLSQQQQKWEHATGDDDECIKKIYFIEKQK